MSRRADDNLVGGRRAEEWLQEAAALTAATWPHPNPRVGAIVLAADGRVLAKHAHHGPGMPHAEAAALSAAGEQARGGTLIVTLEPCSHHGRTAPCVDAVIEAGIARVIAGPVDPDPRVDGRGFAALEHGGVVVVTGVADEEMIAVDSAYHVHRSLGRPDVTLKMAMTADGSVAAADGSSRWITGEEARIDAHILRSQVDAVLVGAGTLRIDDPLLDVRLPGFTGPQPRPVIVAGRKPLPAGAVVYERRPLIYRPELHNDEPAEAEVIAAWSPGGVDLEAMVKDLASRDVLSALVEGGPTLARSLLDAGLIDRLVLYVGAQLGGGAGVAAIGGTFATMADALPLRLTELVKIGNDAKLVFEIGEN